MKIPFLIAAGLAACALWTGGCASPLWTDDVETSPDITLHELERKMAQARDPDGVFKSARSYVQRQTLHIGRFAYLVEVQYLAPDCFRITTRKDNQPDTAIIVNGDSGWSVNYPAKTVEPIVGDSLARLRTMQDLTNPKDGYQALFAQVSLSLVSSGDNEFYKLVCAPKQPDGPQIILYVGKNNFLLRRIVIPELKYTSTIESYSLYEGVMIPQEIEVNIDGRLQRAKIVENKLNAAIDRSLFLPPVFN
jgi:hypothetical protein